MTMGPLLVSSRTRNVAGAWSAAGVTAGVGAGGVAVALSEGGGAALSQAAAPRTSASCAIRMDFMVSLVLTDFESRDSTSGANGVGDTRGRELYRIERRAVEGRPGATPIPGDVGARRPDRNRNQVVLVHPSERDSRAVTSWKSGCRAPRHAAIARKGGCSGGGIGALVVSAHNDPVHHIRESHRKDAAGAGARWNSGRGDGPSSSSVDCPEHTGDRSAGAEPAQSPHRNNQRRSAG